MQSKSRGGCVITGLLVLHSAGCATGTLGSDANDKRSIDATTVDRMVDGAMVDSAMVDARVDAMPDACIPVASQVLLNPSFDLVPAGIHWVQQLADPLAPAISLPPAGLAIPSSPNVAWLGGSLSAVDQISQQIVVPATATLFQVKGKRLVGSAETAATALDTFSMSIRDSTDATIATLLTLSNVDKGATSTFVDFTLTAPMSFAGQTVKLYLRSQTNATLNTNFFFDDVAVNITACR